MDGRVGLRGTDGKVAEARTRGTKPQPPERARQALSRLSKAALKAGLLAWGDEMGAVVARDAGFDPEVLDGPSGDETGAADTVAAAEMFVDADVDLVLFVGDDSTAVDVAETLDGTGALTLGVPTDVKVYSPVFTVSPRDAAHVVTSFEWAEVRGVVDIDEDDHRDGGVRPELRAVAHVPVAEDLQSSEQTDGGTVESLVAGVADGIRPAEGVTYVLGSGSTVGAAKAELGADGPPLGVDVYRDGKVFAHDATGVEILANLGAENVIVVTPTSRQRLAFGRGNPQLSSAVIRHYDVSVVASRSKLDGIPALRVDADDPDPDVDLRG